MKATKFLLLLWALALGSMAGWSQSVTQPTLQLSNPSGTDATDVAVCPSGGNVTLNWAATDATVVRLELRAGTETGPLVTTFYPGNAGTGATDASDGIFEPLTAGTLGSPATVALPALNVGTKYFLLVIAYKTVGMVTTSDSKWVTLAPTALPTTPAFTFTPTSSAPYATPGALVCVQPGNSAIATAVSPDTDKFGYTWTLVEGAPGTGSSPTSGTGTAITITPTAVGTASVTLTAAYRSMSCGTTATTQTLTTVTAVVPKITSTPGDPAGITATSSAGAIFNNAAPYATFPTVPVADKVVCEGTTFTFSAYCVPGQTAVWSRNNVQIGTGSPINITPIAGAQEPTVNGVSEFTYTVKCKLDGSQNCESEGRSITVKTIKAGYLDAPEATPSAAVCQSITGGPTTAVFTASVTCPEGSTALWYSAASGGTAFAIGNPASVTNIVSSPANISTITFTLSIASPTTYTFYSACQKDLCEGARNDFSFVVTPKPDAPSVATSNVTICANNDPFVTGNEQATVLNATPSTGPAGTNCATINWYSSSVNSATPSDFTTLVGTGGSFTVIGNNPTMAPITTYYRARCVSSVGCVSELSGGIIGVTVNPIPAVAPTAGLAGGSIATAGRLCAVPSPNQLVLTRTANCGANTASWESTNGAPTLPDGTANVTLDAGLGFGGAPTITYTYNLRCKDANGCVSPAVQVSFIINNKPATPVISGNPAPAANSTSAANRAVICLDNSPVTTFSVANCLPGETVKWEAAVNNAQNNWEVLGGVTGQTIDANYANLITAFPGNALSDAGKFDDQLINGYVLRATCVNPAYPVGCQESAAPSTTVYLKLRRNESVPAWAVLTPTNTVLARYASLIPLVGAVTNSDICATPTTAVKLVQTDVGTTCAGGTVTWYKSTSENHIDWTTPVVIGTNSPITDSDLNYSTTKYVRYNVRCVAGPDGCSSELSAPNEIVVNARPTPPAPIVSTTPSSTSCLEPAPGGVTIKVDLSGCAAGTGIVVAGFGFTLKPTLVSTNITTGATTTTTLSDIPVAVSNVNGPGTASYNHVVDAPAYNVKNEYTYKVVCTRQYDVLSGGLTATCSSDDSPSSTTVTIISKPAAPTNLVVNTPVVCPNGTAKLTASCAANTTSLKWYNALDPNTAIATFAYVNTSGGALTADVPVGAATASYVARCEVNGCVSNPSTQVTVSVITLGQVTLAQTTPVLCAPASIDPSVKKTKITATGCDLLIGELISWTKNGSPIAGANAIELNVTTGTPSGNEVGITATSDFVATCTRVNGAACPVVSLPITVSVLADPGLSITKTPATDPVCAGTVVTLAATSVLSPIGGWSWTGSGNLVTPGNQNNPSITTPGGGATASMTGTYNLTANYQSCVFQAAPVSLTVVTAIDAPTAIVGPTTDQCYSVSTTASLSTTCPTPQSTPQWRKSGDPTLLATTLTFAAPVPTSGSATYEVKCVLGACESTSSVSFTINTKPFQVSILDIKGSGVSTLANMKSVYPFDPTTDAVFPAALHTGQPDLDKTTAANRLVLQDYKTPRFWTIEAKLCATNPAVKSLTFRLDKLDAVGNVETQFYTTEDNDRYFMFGNGGNTPADQVYTINHPYFAFYNGGLYDAGFPKGKYNVRIDAWDKAGDVSTGLSNVAKTAPWNPSHSGFPSANLLSRTYYIDITTSNGSAREGVSEEETFAVVTPNPVTRTLTLSINGSKGQEVKLNLVDAAGRSLMTRSVTPESNSHREEVDMSNNKTGMYFMQVTSPLKNAALKVLKVSQD